MTFDRRGVLMMGPFAALLAACRPAPASAALEGSLQRIAEVGGVPALGGMVVTPEGLSFLEVGGVRRAKFTEAATKDDLWHLGSNTKAMTAALYGKLVEGGLAKWGATLPELFPDLKLDPAWSKTTIEQILSHHAGVSDKGVLGPLWVIKGQEDKSPVEAQRTALATKALGAAPAGKPGVFEYANLNYILAGAAIERITRTSWETAMRDRLFSPLGMASAGFGPPMGDQPWGHQALPFGFSLRPAAPGPAADNPAAMGPAGTVHASLADYAKFIRLFLTDGGGYLKPETIVHLTTLAPGADYALGWIIRNDQAGLRGRSLAHEGSNTMWHAIALVSPERKIAFVTVANAFVNDANSPCHVLLVQLRKRFAPD